MVSAVRDYEDIIRRQLHFAGVTTPTDELLAAMCERLDKLIESETEVFAFCKESRDISEAHWAETVRGNGHSSGESFARCS